MRPERYTYSYGSNGSLRGARSKLWFGLLVLAALTMLVMVRSHSPFVSNLRTRVDDLLRPVLETVKMPVAGVRHLIEDKRALFGAYEENKTLREENDALRRWEVVAEALKAENEALRNLAAYHPVTQATYIGAQVIAQSPDAYSGTLMIDAGGEQGLISLQPVIDAYGLIGRVVDVGDRTARVLLLSDNSSRVPVITADSRQHAILAGNGDELMRMTFVGGDPSQIKLGEQVMTTSEGGLIPESILVGTVFRRDASGLVVKPMRPLAHAEYVRVVVSK